MDAIFVDDGSTDGGGEVIAACAAGRKLTLDVHVLRLSRNFGKEIALTAGLSRAQADAVVMIDADLQHPIETVEAFFAGWLNEGYDVVFGYQQPDGREPALKRLSRGLFYGLINSTSDVAISPNAGDFRLLSKRAYHALRQLGESQRLMKGLYGWIGFRQKGVPYTPLNRHDGQSKYSMFQLWLLGIEGVTSFSIAPLRLAIWTGLLLAALSGGYGVWTVFEKLFLGIHAPGYPTLIVLISMIGAAQLIFLGVIGEYLGKVLLEVKHRPLFVLESDEHYFGTQSKAAEEAP
jgi:glycosyltransferase involved in cell wall biosynthesis